MHRTMLTLIGATSAALCACSSGGANDTLTGPSDGQIAYDPQSLAAGDNTQHHYREMDTGDNGVPDPVAIKTAQVQIGTPEVQARLHGCTKLPISSMANVLSSRGVDLTAKQGAGSLFTNGKAALGQANYTGRVPEALIASTANLSKQFDIFVAAASELVDNNAAAFSGSTGCSGVKLIDDTSADSPKPFTKDGLTCLMGKPATDDHLFLANQAVKEAMQSGMTETDGEKIAAASVLQAAHTCE